MTPSRTPTATFQLDHASGNLLILSASGLVVADLSPADQLSLVQLVAGAHLQRLDFFRINGQGAVLGPLPGEATITPAHVKDARPITQPLTTPV